MQITKEQYKSWQELLKNIPVSINNFYGDPTIQWDDTLLKLKNLATTKHLGPVGIITKGKLTEKHASQLAEFVKSGLKIVVLISISELPQFEKVAVEHRYENIQVLNQFNIPNIAYIRPLTPPYNTSLEVIEKICQKLKNVGAKALVVSGFRGDENIVKDMNPDETVEWVLRVKVMTKDVYENFKKNCEKLNLQLFTRTSCAVSAVLGDKITYNPYYYSPNLVHCAELHCPLVATCQPVTTPREDSLNLIKFLGYDAEFIKGNCADRCHVSAENRLKCFSCCTTCFHLQGNRLVVKNAKSLGDLTFIRFLTGILTMQPGKNDSGEKEIGIVNLPNFPEIKDVQCLNSWWPYAKIGTRCFGCSYCIEKYYGNERKEFGFPPAELLDRIIKLKGHEIK